MLNDAQRNLARVKLQANQTIERVAAFFGVTPDQLKRELRDA